MIEGWPEKIIEAQKEKCYRIDGVLYSRIPHGHEKEGNFFCKGHLCHDCAVQEGQFHVPGCDVERCPKCYGQAISCRCIAKDDDNYYYDDYYDEENY